MKLLVGTAILCMLAAAPVFAQQQPDNKQQEAAPKSQDNRAEKPAAKPSGKPAAKPAKTPNAHPMRSESQPRQQDNHQAQQQQKADEKAQQNQEKAQQKQARNQQKEAQHNEKEQRQADNRSHDQSRDQGHGEVAENGPHGQGDRRIPEDRYRANFGRDHTFHVHRDRDRFDFGGFAFQFEDAWPSDWSDGDDFYIVEVDGADYLCDARFPDQRILVVVVS